MRGYGGPTLCSESVAVAHAGLDFTYTYNRQARVDVAAGIYIVSYY